MPRKDGEAGVGVITDHAFRASIWYGLCKECGLSAAAHTQTAMFLGPDPALPYRCPDCVMQNRDPCPHR